MQISLEKAILISSISKVPFFILKIYNTCLSIPYASDEISDYFGYSNSDFLEMTAHNLVPFTTDYDSEFIKKGLLSIVDTNNAYNISLMTKHSDGHLIKFEGDCIYLGKDNDALLFFCKKKDESASDQSPVSASNDAEFINALNFAGVNVWNYNLINHEFESLSKSTDIDVCFFENYPYSFIEKGIIDAKDASSYIKNIESLDTGIHTLEYEYWYHFPGLKHPIYFKTKYNVEFDEDNKAIIAHGMNFDFTEAKNAELNFAHRTNAVLKTNPDAIATMQLNLSENICSASNSYILQVDRIRTVDDLISAFLHLIVDKNEQLNFINAFSRASMLAQFNSGILQIKLDHHLLMKNNHDEWVNTVVDIVKNPVSNDVEAIMHITNIHYRKVIDFMVSGTIQREFDFITLAYIKTNSFVLIDRFNQGINDESPNFIEHFTKLFAQIIQIPEELDRVLREFNFDNLIEKINLFGEYTIQFNTNIDPEKNHHRVMRFSFLNNRKDIISISCRDITKFYNEEQAQKKKLTNALIEAENANKAKSEFLSLVSHDIRTPLNGIMGMTQLALSEKDPEKVHQYLTKAEMSSSFLLGLINDLLDMAKIESGKLELHPEPYDNAELYEYINSIIEPLFAKKNMIFNIETHNLVSSVSVDKLRLNQILFNLLSNACKYTPEGGKVSLDISCEKTNSEMCIVTFIIKDNGIGMSEDFQEHLFETFSQENRMSFNHNEGTGLGLSITHSLVEIMGGEISVQSKINEGTTFIVQITCPYIDNSTEENTVEIPKEDKTNTASTLDYTGHHFLLCEDNIINQEIALEIFESLGAKVDVADDGSIGVRMFSESLENYYSAVFMDIRMPNMDGLTASNEIRNLDRADAREVPIIAMTGNAMSADRIECIEAGMNAFITKPIIVSELYKIMSELI